ncbi:FAD-dependent oxidoreductase [Candidatus Saccharibacteria bacterium]|nr:FAD-dependent oxidoreductase [Candidatus Saccharibacteria bacterium]
MFDTKDKYDILVIGGGITGLTAAKTAAIAKKKVAIVEQGRLGGDYIYNYDVPSEVGLDAVRAMSALESIQRVGAKKRTMSLSLAGLERVRGEAIKSVEGFWGEEAIKREGIDVIKGRARFADGGLEVTGGKETKRLMADRYIIATGSVQNSDGMTIDPKAKVWTAADVWTTTRMPKTLMIVGAGMSGVEMAYYATKLGSRVVLIDCAERLLPNEDEEVGRFYGAMFAKLGKVDMVLGARVEEVGEKELVLKRGNTQRRLPITANSVVVLAAGEKPNIMDLGLEEVGVRVGNDGIQVDRSLATSNRRIYAAGTCVDDVPSDLAMLMGKAAVLSIVSRNAPIMSSASSPRTMGLSPAYARIGVTENDLRNKKLRYKKSVVLLSEIPKGRTTSAEGFVCLLTDHKKRIIGAKIIAPEADSMILALAAAVKYQMTVDEMLLVPVPLGSWNEAIRLALTRI